MGKSVPSNMSLYNKVKSEAKRKFKVWPSAYASGWLVKEYKRRGGRYSGGSSKSMKRSSSKSMKRSSSKPVRGGLGRWFAEEWINVCKLPKTVPCGRPKLSVSKWKKDYPYCRPKKRIASGTPKTAGEISKSEIKRRCSIKRKNPMKKVLIRKSKRKSRNRSRRK